MCALSHCLHKYPILVILTPIMMRISFTFIVLVVFVQMAFGQEPEVATDWRDHVIPVKARSVNFHTVPKGATPIHQFVLRNPFQEPVRIVAVTSSCTCTTIDFNEENSVLQTYDEAIISVKLQGDLFDGPRNSTITVSLDKPHRTEIQFNIRGEIRSDLNIVPTFIDFGNVEWDKGATRSLVVTYMGPNSQWRLVDAQCENKYVRAEIISEPARVGRKEFRVNVSLNKDAPNGTINDHLMLISNEVQNRRDIPIPIRATVGTVVRVSPPALSLGVLVPGTRSPVKEVVLRGTKPFCVVKIECNNPAVEVAAKNLPEVQLPIHLLSISYRNPAEGEGAPEDGTMRAIIRVTTDVPGLTPTFYVTAMARGSE